MKTFLIGLDGATFTILNPLMANGVMPHLRDFCRRATQGNLLSTLPHVTPTAWTSLVTGRSPGNHGIFDFIRAQENQNGLFVRFLSARDLHCETIWSLANRQARRVTALNFPFSEAFPQQAIHAVTSAAAYTHDEVMRLRHAFYNGTVDDLAAWEPDFLQRSQANGLDATAAQTLFAQLQNSARHAGGYVIPGFISWKHLRRYVAPPHLFNELQQLPGFNLSDLAWDMDKEQKSVQMMSHEEYAPWIESHLRREQQWFTIAQHLIERDPCDLTALMFDGVDKLQHLAWHLIDPQLYPARPSAWERETRALCLDYFRQLDTFLGQIFELAGAEARVFLASDHGFCPTWDIFYLNVWLHQQGYLQWSKLAAQQLEPDAMFAGQTKAQRFDWESTLAYALTPSSNGIHIRVAKTPGQPGIAPQDYDAFRRKLSEELLAYRHPVTGKAVVTQVVTREEGFSGTQMSHAPDLTVVLHDYGFISAANAPAPLAVRDEAKGMHHPEGIFLAAGPGIRRGTTIAPLSILDVCPALLYSLDLPIPSDLEGALPEAIFASEWLDAVPPQRGAPTMCLDNHAASTVLEPAVQATGQDAREQQEENDQMLARLKALGYLN